MELAYFNTGSFYNALQRFFENMNIPVNYFTQEPTTAKELLGNTYKPDHPAHQLIGDIYFLGMVDDAAFENSKSEKNLEGIKEGAKDYDGILIFGVELNQRGNDLLPTRTQFAEITRAFNREYHYTPVVVVFKYDKYISFASAQRLKYSQEWREGERVGKVSFLKDVDSLSPHTGHLRILQSLAIERVGREAVNSFASLYKYWQKVFSVSILNERFYKELFDWYCWALKEIQRYPPGVEEQSGKEMFVIRLITRLIFIWFMKQKGLVPEKLFSQEDLKQILVSSSQDEDTYYQAILQNLFFATLNTKQEERDFGSEKRGHKGWNEDYGNPYVFRYHELFKNPEDLKNYFTAIPFLNGGLFECLDDKQKGIIIDGFSRTEKNQPQIPNFLFFSEEREVNIDKEHGSKAKRQVRGILNLLQSYHFTIDESTPIDVEIALDPELLGSVFENLLASYNPETATTARKSTGSYYTPREIVDYMVDESLIAYFKSSSSLQSSSSFQLEEGNSSFQLEDSQARCLHYNHDTEVEITKRNLPHWKQKDATYFVTFHLADSLPKEKTEQLRLERENWKSNHKEPYSKDALQEYYRLFSDRIENWLNAGYGSCCLAVPENAKIVSDALKYFDGSRYQLGEWVVMPNHVHVLVKPLGENRLSEILHTWKSFTSNKINKCNGNKGQLWMHESYDHIVRNEQALYKIQEYIAAQASSVTQSSSLKVCKQDACTTVAQASSLKVCKQDACTTVAQASSLKVCKQDACTTVAQASSLKVCKQDACTTLSKQDAYDTVEDKFRNLLSYSSSTNPFTEDETNILIKAVNNLKIVDPAVGSGAFPMGILNKLVFILSKIDPKNILWKEAQIKAVEKHVPDPIVRQKLKEQIEEQFTGKNLDYGRKLYLIQNCIYGVDIQQIAVEIAKLRFFISLLVDEKIDKNKENWGIEPLPNLDFKIMQGNSLIEDFHGISLNMEKKEMPHQRTLFADSSELDRLVKDLHNKQNALFYATDPNNKKCRKNEVEEAIVNIFHYELQRQKEPYFAKLKNIEEVVSRIHNPEAKQKYYEAGKARLYKEYNFDFEAVENELREWTHGNKVRPFFPWKLYFADVFQQKGGFDVVIANPPYVRQEDIKEYKPLLQKAGYKVYNSTSDFYTYFYELSYNLLAPNRFSCFISSNKWMRAKYGEKLRNFFRTKTRIVNLIDFGGHKVFDATVDTNIMLFQKGELQKEYQLPYINIESDFTGDNLDGYVKQKRQTIKQNELNDSGWTLADDNVLRFKKKIEKIGTPLKNWDVKIYRGIITGFNKAFIIDNEIKERFCQEDPKSAEIIKPILRGRDVNRYSYKWAGLWLIKIESRWTNKNRGAKNPEMFFKETYPAIYRHLKSMGEKEGKGKGLYQRDDQGDYWWELRDCDYYPEFEKEKIVFQEMVQESSFTYDKNNHFYCLDTGRIITGECIEFLVSILNSMLFFYSVKNFYGGGALGQKGIRMKHTFFENFPIPKIPEAEQQPFITLVNRILSLRKSDPNADISVLEAEIDRMVYELYGLTEEEIAIVEGRVRK